MHSILRITCLTLRKCFRSGLKGMKHKQTNQNETEERPDIAFLVHKTRLYKLIEVTQ